MESSDRGDHATSKRWNFKLEESNKYELDLGDRAPVRRIREPGSIPLTDALERLLNRFAAAGGLLRPQGNHRCPPPIGGNPDARGFQHIDGHGRDHPRE